MAIDFFADCNTTTNAKRFGLCDDPPPPHAPAYLENAITDKWIAIVENDAEIEVLFTALDHCLNIRRQDDTNKQESLCDCMLTYNDRIIFVELKDKNHPGVLSEAIGQLENTIRLFSESHNLTAYKKRFAFFCNKRKPHFPFDQQEKRIRFKKENNVILVPFATIKIR